MIELDARSKARITNWLQINSDFLSNLRKEQNQEDKEYTCKHCQKEFFAFEQRQYCSRQCYRMGTSSPNRPSKEILASELKTHTYRALGLKYGVSPTTIRSWARAEKLLIRNSKGVLEKRLEI